MSITVRELVEIPHLRISVLAGGRGADRLLSWAHACELPDPTEWLNGGELVLSVGMAISDDPDEQVAYIRRLAAAEAGALAFGDTSYAKQLSPAALAAADELGLPILWVAFEVPYIAVARAVIDSNQREEQNRLKRLQRAYEAVRTSAEEGRGADELLHTLADLAGCALHVLELPYGNPVIGDEATLDAAITEALVAEARERESLPAVMRLDVDERPAIGLPVQASRVGVLLAVAEKTKPDLPLLQHIATIMAVELEKRFGERERRRRLGAELLAKLIDQTIEASAAEGGLADHGLDDRPLAIVAWPLATTSEADTLHQRLFARRVPHLLLRRDLFYALIPAEAAARDIVLAELPSVAELGVSAPLGRPTRAPDAMREARLALKTAAMERRRVVVYGEGHGDALLVPRSVSEAEAVFASTLGPLSDYDAENETELLPSLRAFLEHNRGWQRTAAHLHIHKQTLHYRMRRVEELTGRHLDSTADVAALWYGLEAEALLDAAADGAPPSPRSTKLVGSSAAPARTSHPGR